MPQCSIFFMYIEVNGIQIFYRLEGKGEKTILALHGGPGGDHGLAIVDGAGYGIWQDRPEVTFHLIDALLERYLT